MAEIALSLAEKLDRAREGRTQTWIINKMNEVLKEKINEVQFSRKKLGNDTFTDREIQVLKEILPTFEV